MTVIWWRETPHQRFEMTNFAAIRNIFNNRCFGTQFFPISLLSKKGFSSSGPVRFIPGQFSGNKRTQKFTFADSESNRAPESSNLDERSLGNSHFDYYSYIGGSSRTKEDNEPVREDPDYVNELNTMPMAVGDEPESVDTDNENELNTISMAVGDEPARADTDDENELNTISMAVGDDPAEGTDYENELNKMPMTVGDGLKKIREEVEQVAVGLLATRAMPAPELQRKLRGKKYPFHIVESIIADFKARGLLNDSIYAESFTRSRWLSSTWGPRRIKHALLDKGVTEIETERARRHVFEGDRDASEEGIDSDNMRLGMCKLSMERLFVQASKQWLRSLNMCPEKRRARMVRWLLYRGFDWEATICILKRLQSQHPA